MKINLERLIDVVQKSFDNTSDYRLCFVAKKWYQMNEKEQVHANWCERNEYGSSNEVSDLCAILNIDCNRLYTIARLARKWEQKQNWLHCFPAAENEERILKYLEKDPYINYDIHWIHNMINNKAKRKAANKAA